MSWAAGTTVNTSEIWNYAFTKSASYIIRVNGSYYEAINGTTGKVSFGGSGDAGGATGTDAKSVWQAAGDALTTGGRIILRGPATYPLSSVPNFTTGPLFISGEGDSTVLQNDGSTLTGSLIRFTGNYMYGIRDLKIDNNSVGTTTHGISFEAGSCIAENLWVKDTQGTGILAQVDATNFDLCVIRNCRIDGSGYTTTHVGPGIRIDHAVGSSETIDHVVIEGNWCVNGAEHGIKIYDSAVKAGIIKGNYVVSNYASGIVGSGNNLAIIGNHVDTTTTYYGIPVSGNNCRITDNYVANTTEYGIIATGTDTLIANNNVYNATTGCIGSSGLRNKIHGNECDTAGTSCIIVSANHNSILGNTTQSGTTRGIYLNNAEYCLVQSNIIHDTTGIGEYGTSDNNRILDNIFTGTTFYVGAGGTSGFPLGTLVKNNQGFNPKGVIATPFKDASTSISIGLGDAATPTASTDYIVKNCDIIISSTDSGNANNAILIKSPAGTQINPTTLSTLDAYFIPAGYKINWGAYTGAAPTTVVSYL